MDLAILERDHRNLKSKIIAETTQLDRARLRHNQLLADLKAKMDETQKLSKDLRKYEQLVDNRERRLAQYRNDSTRPDARGSGDMGPPKGNFMGGRRDQSRRRRNASSSSHTSRDSKADHRDLDVSTDDEKQVFCLDDFLLKIMVRI